MRYCTWVLVFNFLCPCLALLQGTDSHSTIELISMMKQMNLTIQSQSATLEAQSKRISALEMADQQSQVAFYATLKVAKQLGQLQTIEFDNVVTNVGNGYDVRHGHFTAPRNGIYTFAAGIMSTSTDLHVQIEKNGIEIGRIYSDTTGLNNAANVVFVQLTAGDMVWVRHMSGIGSQEVFGGNYCFFGGVLNASL